MYKGEFYLEPAAVRPRRSDTGMRRARALTRPSTCVSRWGSGCLLTE